MGGRDAPDRVPRRTRSQRIPTQATGVNLIFVQRTQMAKGNGEDRAAADLRFNRRAPFWIS